MTKTERAAYMREYRVKNHDADLARRAKYRKDNKAKIKVANNIYYSKTRYPDCYDDDELPPSVRADKCWWYNRK